LEEFVKELIKLHAVGGRNEAVCNTRKINVQISEEDRCFSVWETQPE